jgi:hypothetical protein
VVMWVLDVSSVCVYQGVEWVMALNCLFGNREVLLVKLLDVEIFPKIQVSFQLGHLRCVYNNK